MDVNASKHFVWPCYTVECMEKIEGYPTIPNSSSSGWEMGRKLEKIVEKSLLCGGGN
jgi:hypothetical protein